MDIAEIIAPFTWWSVTDLIPRLISPYLVIGLLKLVFREKFQLNVSYFVLALVMNFYFCLISIPVIGIYEQLMIDFRYFLEKSFIYILLCWGINILFSKLIKLVRK